MTTLEDLRKANLKEQRGGGTPVVAKPEPIQEKPVKAEAVGTPLVADLTEHGLAMEPTPEPAPTPVLPSAPVVVPTPKSVAPAVIRETIVEAIAVVPVAPEQDPLVARMRAAVLRKRLIPAGVKTTVDMSPELFWRAKKYCHDHSNSTLRQLMLEILTQFLDEEGY